MARKRSPRADGAPSGADPLAGPPVQRFDLHCRIQHLLMMVSFLVLVLTGLPLRFASVPFSAFFLDLMGGALVAGKIHKVAAVVMGISCVHHLAHVAVRLFRGTLRWDVLPRWKDFRDVVHNVFYFLGIRRDPPRFGRYAYYEKFDYWAVFWGVPVMFGSGLILAFPIQAASIFPPWVLTVAHVVHGEEAVLAALAITIWHFYNVHLRPGSFPMNWTWITGSISRRELYENHRLEYERTFGSEKEPGDG